ncbi:MAG TPA: RNA polymerase sigma factor [Bryobacteraceae bacterium]|jgi:RNA polymerase sigma-70 factor (ECF subfamily)
MIQGVNTIGGSAPALDLDAQLMLRVRDGDEHSFGVLLEKHRNPVIHFVYRMVQDRAIAEELSQEVFLRVYRSRETYEPTARFTTWLFRIATHLALNWLRDGRNERGHQRLDAPRESDKDGEMQAREVADRKPSVEQRMVYETRLQEVRSAIALLPEKQRAAVLMHKYQEMDYSQISNVLECSESAVKSLLFRAYEALRASLAHMDTASLDRGVAR